MPGRKLYRRGPGPSAVRARRVREVGDRVLVHPEGKSVFIILSF
ncbi:hypothetical protein GFS60_06772 (plasmid) [Rhodococcus sp. WAY2]|nr:hypothetical protein GFS60_06772 [Rhodococcus sp. WAY2]